MLNEALLKEKTGAYLKNVIGATLDMPAQQFDEHSEFERYGLDSILVVQLTNKLREVFKSISTTVFFECNTIAELSKHLLATEKDALIALFGGEGEPESLAPATQPATTATMPVAVTATPHLHSRRGRRFSAAPDQPRNSGRDIAIIGLAGQYAQADSLEAFWDNLQAGKNCISDIPPQRWDWQQYFSQDKGGVYSRWGGFIPDVDTFDPLFFNISPREAEMMDPQERLFVQAVWQCIEDAGYTPGGLSETREVGVFVGVMNNNYPGGARHWSIANRVSYLLNFYGPSMALDTACSSSLTAIYLALESLHKGDCECAIAGGVNLIIDPAHIQRLTAVGMLAHDDRNKTFAADADGFVDGEGIGAVVLKPLAKAVADGDPIYAVIKGGAINAGGKTSGFTVPNPKAHHRLIAKAIQAAGVEARSISYIEAHGTGTSLGDPIEIAGLSKAFATSDKQFCAIGSVKTNIGHCESAAGIAGLSKILLQLKHGQLAPSLHAAPLNPEIDFANSPFRVQHTLEDWQRPVLDGKEYPRRAGISSFGAGGANAHLIIEEAPASSVSKGVTAAARLFVLSAKNEERLRHYAADMLRVIETNQANLADMLYTLQIGREAMEERLALLVESAQDLRLKLQAFIDGKDTAGLYRGNSKKNKSALAVFESDEDLQSVVETWLARGKYNKLLDLWVKGLDFDWRTLYDAHQPRRIHLPTYPFAKERYWLTQEPGELLTAPASSSFPRQRESSTLPLDSRLRGNDERTSLINMPRLLNSIQLQDDSRPRAFLAQTDAFDALLLPLMQAQLATVDDADIIPLLQPWYEASRKVFGSVAGGDADALWREWEAQKAAHDSPMLKARCELVEACLRALPDVLLGKLPATDVLFPESSMSRVEGVYKNNALADYFNDIVANLVAAYIDTQRRENPTRQVRLFEIGAGTGGTSAVIFQHLTAEQKQHIEEYRYTDLSKAFLMHAEENYGADNPFLRYQIFNAEQPVEQQDVAAGSYDLVIAANVLHATRNIRNTLRNAKALLNDGGLLLLNELSQNNLYLHLTFGLLEGWWLFDDPDTRIPGSPAIAPDSWRQVLEQLDFASVVFPAEQAHDFGLQIVVAQSGSHAPRGNPVLDAPHPVQTATRSSVHATHGNEATGTHLGYSAQMLENHVKDSIAEKLSAALKIDIDKIDNDESFSDYGVDSIIGVSFVELLNQALGIELETTVIFDYSSVNRLAAYILSEYRDTIAKTQPQAEQNDAALDALPAPSEAELSGSQASLGNPVLDASHPVLTATRSRLHSHATHGNEAEEQPRRGASSGSGLMAPIAIIGMSGRFPQSDSVEELWRHLENGDDLIEEVTRWDLSAYVAEDPNFCSQGGFVSDIDKFDPLFFNISGAEAAHMDPQQRLFLQEAWKTLEDAGYAGERVSGQRCGVYVGCDQTDYSELFGGQIPAQAFWGNMGSIIPARIAYYLDLQGPAIAVDTACSSSLTAMHLACQGLWNGETDLALAGGVFITFTPKMYEMANKAGMLSPSGRCHTFDEKADGFVPGEGVGVVMLKRLADAIADGDQIHGVIQGSGINQDGTTNGITAPSAASQERLERQVYDSFHINPAHITMLEAHGTGTSLGDPIECTALNKAFRAYTDKQGYCAIGSLKSNIGHTQLAAGVAGVIKVLLSLQHKKIPASLHYHNCNPKIQFENSPFYVNTELKEWTVPEGQPRLAAVSSFGASGTNAHMVLAEAPAPASQPPHKPAYLIVLSARTREQLQQQAQQLLNYCEQNPTADCGNMSRTLLLGRKHLKHRLACVPRNLEELTGWLEKWLDKGKVRQVYYAEINESDVREQPALKQYGNQCIQDTLHSEQAERSQELLSAIADLYIQGYALDFAGLFAEPGYSTLSLPTYPFARKRYWIDDGARASARQYAVLANDVNDSRAEARAPVLHPLIQRNTSDFSAQRFSSSFSGEEFFLRDHVVQGNKVLPGVAYLEMARAAVQQAAGVDGGIVLKNVVWAQPIMVTNAPVDVHIALLPDATGDISYEVYSLVNEARVTHSQGQANILAFDDAPTWDLAALQAQCGGDVLSGASCYQTFRQIGLNYGAGHQAIDSIHIGVNQALAKLSIPAAVADSAAEFVLHPGLMDAALQATIGLSVDELREQGAIRPFLAFALERLEILRAPPSTAWAFIRYSTGSSAQDAIRKIDIDVCDEHGQVCLRLHKFTSREVAAPSDAVGTLLIRPLWREEAADSRAPHPNPLPEGEGVYQQHITVFIEPAADWQLPAHNNAEHIVLTADTQDIAQRIALYNQHMFARIKHIIQSKPKHTVIFQVVISPRAERRLFGSFMALLKTAHSEYSKFIGHLIEVADVFSPTLLTENLHCPSNTHIRYENGKRFLNHLEEVEVLGTKTQAAWKNRGVYLITGGLGGLGLVFARAIASQAENPVLVLSDIMPAPPTERLAALDTLRDMGATVDYHAADVAQKSAVEQLIQHIEQNYGRLDGVLHTAGLIRDNFIINKTQEEFDVVLAPKVAGTLNLDAATVHLALDCFVMFSSVAGVMSNIGQADYACANAFLDSYAAYRQELVNSGKRHGKTLAINWPLWAEGGMTVDPAVERMMAQNFGIAAMPTETGIQALDRALALDDAQVMVMTAELAKLRRTLGLESASSSAIQALPGYPASPALASGGVGEEDIQAEPGHQKDAQDKLLAVLTQHVTELLKIPAEDIDPDAELSEFGFDSISLTEFSNNLNQAYGLELTPVLFFEYPTLNDFAAYLREEHGDVFAARFGIDTVARGSVPTQENVTQGRNPALPLPESAPNIITAYETSRAKADDTATLDKLINMLAQNVAEQLKIAPADIDKDAELSEFGFDSISLTEFSNNLNQAYGLELTPVLFFEYATLTAFARYLLDEHGDVFAARFGVTSPEAGSPGIQALPGYLASPAPPESSGRAGGTGVQAEPGHQRLVTGNRFITARPAAATQAAPPQRDEAVAVIGLSGVFPKAPNAEAFWRNLADGMDCIDDVPKARWHWDNFFSQSQWRAQDQAETKWGGFLDAPENFDPAFFGISSSEAELMDPQQRLLMTETWKALEDAGYSTSNEHGNKTGVFIGTIGTDYDKLAEINGVPPGIHSVTGNNPALLSARIASFLDLKGPNMAVATTCSSSLVAIHLACQSIRNGESDMAVAGGAFIMSTPERYLFMNKGGLVSPSGKCRTFDDGADGFIPGESVGVVVLKPLSAAIKDRDHIYGVITGSGVSHDGKTSAISAPSRAAQKELALAVYQQAGLNPADVTYVEAHGTASKLGDHIEFDAMAEAFREYTDKTQYCAIGSVRTNIGHSVASACISSVIKVLMGLKYKQIPPSLNFETANEYIKFDKSPFYVPTALRDWQAAQDGKRRACINAFALSGTNAHAVIEEFIDADREAEKLNEPLLFVLSAKNQARLQAYAGDMSEFLQRHAELALADIAYTLQTRRMPMDVRLAFSAASMTELCAKLSAYHDNPQAGGGLYSGNVRQGKKLYSQLFAGATGDDFIKLAMQRREWSRLAQLWVNGAKIDWRPLYENSAARHVSLPTYPFAEKAFWVAASAVAASASFPRMRESMPPDSLRRENDGSGGEKQVEVLYDLRLPSAANPVKPKPTDANTVLYDLRLPENNTAPSSPQESSGMDARLRGDDDGVGNDGEIQNTATTPPLAAEAKPPLQVKVEQELTHILANLLQVNGNEINTAQEIAEYNLDSIVLTAYVGKINDTYDLNFMPMALADYPTISAFADYLCREYTEALEDYYA